MKVPRVVELAWVEREPSSAQVTLRAPAWRSGQLARRGLATLAGLTSTVSLAGLPLGWHVVGSVPSLLIPAGVVVWASLVRWARSETAELDCRGATRSLLVKRRGRFGWLPGREELSFVDRQRSVRVVSGTHGGQVWFELWEAGLAGATARRLTPRFSVEGVDRRDECRALAALWARRLGLGLSIERDDLAGYQVLLSRSGAPPSPPALAFAGFRAPATEVTPRFDRPPSFEEPSRPPPPLAPEGSPELFERVRQDGDRWLVESPPPSARSRLLVGSYVGAIHAFVPLAVGLGLWRHRSGADDVVSFFLLAGIAVVLCLIWWGAREPRRRWRLLPDRLELAPGHVVRRGESSAVSIEPFRARNVAAWFLWLHTSQGRYQLAETRGSARTALEALALEVARRLDAPLRIGGD
jgi:hypothetical protein